jgi:dipeptidyl aminopeptidase/acylaminoacyl peptidase
MDRDERSPRDVMPHYRLPPPELASLVDAPPWPSIHPSPCGRHLLLPTFEGWPGIAAVARPFHRLAGLQIDAERFDRRRLQACVRLTIVDIASGASHDVAMPAGARMGGARWSPDGARLAFPLLGDAGLEIWLADAASGRASRLGDRHMNGIADVLFWTADSRALATLLAPRPLRAPPSPPRVPSGPRIEETAGREATNWTFPDLLRSPDDEALFAHFLTSEPVLIEIANATTLAPRARDGLPAQVEQRSLGEPDLYRRLTPAPGGEHFLVERFRPPFSRLVPWHRFAHDVSVRDRAGRDVALVADVAAAEEVPLGGVVTGPRRIAWHPLEAATLFWTEALDGGDPRRRGVQRDRLMLWRAPFRPPPEELLRTGERLIGATWVDPPTGDEAARPERLDAADRERIALPPDAPEESIARPAQQDATALRAFDLLVTEWDRDRRWVTTALHDASGRRAPRVLFDRSSRDDYGDPGDPLLRPRPSGGTVRVEEDAIFLAGRGATPAGDRPFLDRLSLTTGDKQRLVASTDAIFEQVVSRAETGAGAWIVLRESAASPPALLLRGDGPERPLFAFPHPHPGLAVRRRLLRYRRRDGVELSATLTSPVESASRLPLLLWTYPIEHNEAATAGQVRAAPDRFLRLSPRSPLILAACGYAVLTDVAMPIVGDPETVNDGFVAQIVDSVAAAIAAAAESGNADPERVAIGGHSYGAYTAASLLAHSRLFRAGIAESGAYNRTLTPFGFQGERRQLWDARDAYVALSPFLFADRIEAPLLLIHGEVDENPGTHPLQSERLFHALQGLGKTARLVLLPAEGHRYAARETVLHVLAEWLEWLERWVES